MMRAFILFPLFAISQICQAFVTPDIYTLTQPASTSPDLGEDSRPPTVPSQSRSGNEPASRNDILMAPQKTCSRTELRVEHLSSRLRRRPELVNNLPEA